MGEYAQDMLDAQAWALGQGWTHKAISRGIHSGNLIDKYWDWMYYHGKHSDDCTCEVCQTKARTNATEAQ